MSDDEISTERLLELNLVLLGRIIQLRAYVKACTEVLCIVGGGDSREERRKLRIDVTNRARAYLDKELAFLETQDPALSARIDVRNIEEVLGLDP